MQTQIGLEWQEQRLTSGYWTDALYVLLDFTREYPGLPFTFKVTERGTNFVHRGIIDFEVANGAMRVRDDEDSG